MTDMINRAAQAILAKVPAGYGMTADEAAGYARAAIEAMRDPSKAMVDSGVAFALTVSLGVDYRWPKYVADKHRLMIDAALNEEDA